MPLPALALVLLAGLVHAGWNVVAKQSGGDARFALLSSIGVATVWAPVGGWFAWRDAPAYGAAQWSLLAASGALHVLYFVTLLRGYRLGDLSVVYPVARGMGPLLSAVAASVILDERLGVRGGAGLAGIVGGVALLGGLRMPTGAPATPPAGAPQPPWPAGGPRPTAGVAYGALTGVFIAAYTVVDGWAVKRAGVSPVLVDYLGNAVRIPLTALLIGMVGSTDDRPLRVYARDLWKPALLVGAVSPVAYVLVLFAATIAPLSHVAPAREVSLVFATLLGGTLLRERDPGRRLLGAGCIAAGVVALATTP
jgi:drug/metabolite transporter (DMT)-like permease